MDYIRLRQILPEEIWKIVAENLLKGNQADVENLANSSPFFRDLLVAQRTTFLAEKAFDTMAPTVWNSYGVEYLPVLEIMKCREVCSHWNTAVDKVICKKMQFIEKDCKGSFTHARQRINNFFNDCINPETPNKFIKHFEETHPSGGGALQTNRRNHFIGTSLYTGIKIGFSNHWYDAIQRRYVEGLNKIILNYGFHIHHLTIDVQGNHKFFDDVLRFKRWLISTPNLRTLSIYCDKNWSGVEVVGYEANDPVFKLEHLEHLDTRNLLSPIFNKLIRYNSHVSKLTLQNCKDDYDFFTFSLPNLNELEMEYCSAQISITLGFPEVNWPLESLKLVYGNEDEIGCAALLKVIQKKFANTLVYLELVLNSADLEIQGAVWRDFKTCRLVLPKLKKIKLDVGANLTCLDFLLPMKDNLEEISVNGGREFPLSWQQWVKRENIVEFIGFEGKMLESNIWHIFLKLKKIEIKRRWDRELGFQCWFYSRKDWMRTQSGSH